jgi:hypothetical protein
LSNVVRSCRSVARLMNPQPCSAVTFGIER